jgi:DNA-binding transcriptional LysR family regulator
VRGDEPADHGPGRQSEAGTGGPQADGLRAAAFVVEERPDDGQAARHQEHRAQALQHPGGQEPAGGRRQAVGQGPGSEQGEAEQEHALAAAAVTDRPAHDQQRLPASVARSHGEGLRVLAVRDPEMRGRLALAWRTEGPVSPAARALIAHARAALPEC